MYKSRDASFSWAAVLGCNRLLLCKFTHRLCSEEEIFSKTTKIKIKSSEDVWSKKAASEKTRN